MVVPGGSRHASTAGTAIQLLVEHNVVLDQNRVQPLETFLVVGNNNGETIPGESVRWWPVPCLVIDHGCGRMRNRQARAEEIASSGSHLIR
eukprot:7253145-Prymnesium_polylepis.3